MEWTCNKWTRGHAKNKHEHTANAVDKTKQGGGYLFYVAYTTLHAILESEYGRGLYYASGVSHGREIGYYDGVEVTLQQYNNLDEYIRGCAIHWK